MSNKELVTPVTPEEADDIRVTLDTEEGKIYVVFLLSLT